MSRLQLVNRLIFDIPVVRPIGRHIYASRRARQTPAQSTVTKFFRNLHQLTAFDTVLLDIFRAGSVRILVAGCSMGCEAFSIAGHLALSYPGLDFYIDASDISQEALTVARSAEYRTDHGLGQAASPRERALEARLFDRSGDTWRVRDDIRARVNFTLADVLAPEFPARRDYDCVFGQNFMIHMSTADAERAFSALVLATRPGGALFVGGMDLEQRPRLILGSSLVPVDWNIAAIHDADYMRRSAWPWSYWALEPMDRHAKTYLTRYATIFRKPALEHTPPALQA